MPKLAVNVVGDSVSFFDPLDSNNKVNITFERTFRISDDDKVYPLPPSLGPFPICKVDDYADKCPPKWRAHGGVFIPMYQRVRYNYTNSHN